MPNYTKAYARKLAEKLGERLSSFDWINPTRHKNIRLRSSTQDVSTELSDAIGEMHERGGGYIHLVEGDYMIANSIVGQPGVAICGVPTHPRYGAPFGATGTARGRMATRIRCLPSFPEGGIMIDLREKINTHMQFLDVIGDSPSGAIEQADATTTGIAYGTAQMPSGGPTYARHGLSHCSVTCNKIGIDCKEATYCWWDWNNIASNWYIGVKMSVYGGNDGSYKNNYINSSNWLLTDVADPWADPITGTGLYLGSGCAWQQWSGGKIEWCGTGIVLDEFTFGLRFSDIQMDTNMRWHVLMRKADQYTKMSDIKFIGCRFFGAGHSAPSGKSAHVYIDGGGNTNNPIFFDFIGCSFKRGAFGDAYEYSEAIPTAPVDAIIMATNAGYLQAGLHSNDFEIGANNNRILIDSSVNGLSKIDETGNRGDFVWEVDPAVRLQSRFRRLAVGGDEVINDTRKTADFHNPIGPTLVVMRNGSVDQAGTNIQEWRGDDDTPYATMSPGGILHTRGFGISPDFEGILFIGRYDSGGLAVLDFADFAGDPLKAVSVVSLRRNGAEFLRKDAVGMRIDTIGVNTAPDALFSIVTANDVKFGANLMLPAKSAGVAKIDGGGLFTTGRVKVDDASEVQASTLTAGQIVKWDGAKFVSATIADFLPSQSGNAGKVLMTNGTTASWVALSMSDIAGLVAALAGKSDVGHTHTFSGAALAGHAHTVSGGATDSVSGGTPAGTIT